MPSNMTQAAVDLGFTEAARLHDTGSAGRTGGPVGQRGFLLRLAAALGPSYRWARAVERRYNRAGPAAVDPAALPAAFGERTPPG